MNLEHANHCIECSLDECANHCVCEPCCALDHIQVGTCGEGSAQGTCEALCSCYRPKIPG